MYAITMDNVAGAMTKGHLQAGIYILSGTVDGRPFR